MREGSNCRARVGWRAALAILLVAPGASASWATLGEGVPEPNTPHDVAAYMFPEPNRRAEEKVYFNAIFGTKYVGSVSGDVLKGSRLHPLQMGSWTAWLGFWRDCNRDGYVGSAFLGLTEYEAALEAPDPSICPAGSPYHRSRLVTEFRWIGPGAEGTPFLGSTSTAALFTGSSRDVSDAGALVWGDWGLPSDRPPFPPFVQRFPAPRGTFDDYGSTLRWVDQAAWGAASDAIDRAAGKGSFDRAADALAPLPSPLGTVRDRLNDSRTDSGPGATGTPLFTVWDCDRPREGPAGLVPAIDPQANPERGSLVPAGEDLLRADPAVAGGSGGCGWSAWPQYVHLESDPPLVDHFPTKVEPDHVLEFTPGWRVRSGARALDERWATAGAPVSAARYLGLDALWSSSSIWLFTGTTRPPWTLLPRGTATNQLATFYAHVTVASPGALPSGSERHAYGAEECATTPPGPKWDWVCDPAEWRPLSPVAPGDPYELRDTDCFDNTIRGDVRARIPRSAAPDRVSDPCPPP